MDSGAEQQTRLLTRRMLLAAGISFPLLAACQGEGTKAGAGPSARSKAGPFSGDSGDATGNIGQLATKSGQLSSRHWPGHLPRWVVMYPAGVSRPPVAVSLHGKGGDALTTFSDIRLQDHILETGLAVAAIDGGDYYWHARRSESTGANGISPNTPPCDTGAMVRDDFIPMLGRMGLDVSKVGFIGWSMGGYGALLLSETMGPEKVAAVAPMSAALWVQPGLSALGAFDDAEDWQQHDVYSRRPRFAHIPIRLACGTSDPFYASDKTFVDGFPATPAYDVSGVFDPGEHNDSFWASHGEGQMRFLASHLHDR